MFDRWITHFERYRLAHLGQDRSAPFSVDIMLAFIVNPSIGRRISRLGPTGTSFPT
jgi:hypothetical protein